MKQEKRPKPGF